MNAVPVTVRAKVSAVYRVQTGMMRETVQLIACQPPSPSVRENRTLCRIARRTCRNASDQERTAESVSVDDQR